MDDAVGPWTVLDSQTALSTKWFKIVRYLCRMPDGTRVPEYYVHSAPDSVLAIAITPSGQLVLKREYRLPLGRVSLDFPGGLVEEDDVAPEQAALRELIEETGYASDRCFFLASFDKDPGFSSARVHVYVFEDCQPSQFRTHEAQTEIVLLDIGEVLHAVDEGELSCSYCVSAALRAARHLHW